MYKVYMFAFGGGEQGSSSNSRFTWLRDMIAFEPLTLAPFLYIDLLGNSNSIVDRVLAIRREKTRRQSIQPAFLNNQNMYAEQTFHPLDI